MLGCSEPEIKTEGKENDAAVLKTALPATY